MSRSTRRECVMNVGFNRRASYGNLCAVGRKSLQVLLVWVLALSMCAPTTQAFALDGDETANQKEAVESIDQIEAAGSSEGVGSPEGVGDESGSADDQAAFEASSGKPDADAFESLGSREDLEDLSSPDGPDSVDSPDDSSSPLLITADMASTGITEGGTYLLDSSIIDDTSIAIKTSDEVVITTNGETANSGVAFVLPDGGANLVLSNASVYRNVPAGDTAPMISFGGAGNLLTLEGDNGLIYLGNKKGRVKTASALIEVPNGSDLTIDGTGKLSLESEGDFYTGAIIGAKTTELNGTINFGHAGASRGPEISIEANYSTTAIGSLTTGNAGLLDGIPGSINFNCGRIDVQGRSWVITAPCKNADDLQVNVASNATVNMVSGDRYSLVTSPLQPPVGGGFHDGGRVLNGSFKVGQGSIVRCYSANAELGLGYSHNLIFMDTLNAAGEAVVGYTLDISDAVSDYDASVAYTVDGVEYFYYPGMQSGSSEMPSDSASMLPLFLTPEDHAVTVNGKEYDLKWNGTSFSIVIPLFNIVYDTNIGEDFLYQTLTTEPTLNEFSADGTTYALGDPVLEGYRFKGWFLYERDAEGGVVLGNQVTQIDSSDPGNRKDFSLIAQWEPIMLGVPYDHYEGDEETVEIQYGKSIIVDGDVRDDELTTLDIENGFRVTCPDEAVVEEGFTTVGYQASFDEGGNGVFSLRSGMPDVCRVTVDQPRGCEIWATNPTTSEKYEMSGEGVFEVPNGTVIGLRAYPEDGFAFENFTLDALPLLDSAGDPLYAYTVREHVNVSADVRMITFVRASIAADETAELVGNDANTGLRKSTEGIEYRIIKTGTRYVNGAPEYVVDYPVYDGDPLYEDDVLTCIGSISSSVTPLDPNMAYVGNVSFSFNEAEKLDSEAKYRVKGDEEGSGSAGDLEAQVGELRISSFLPPIKQKTWLHVADVSWYNSEESVFYLSTPEQLAGVVKLLGEGQHFKNKSIVLTSDISLSNNDGTTGKRLWDWCATDTSLNINSFDGTFDGNGQTISNLLAEVSSGQRYASLLGHVKGTVANLTLEGKISSSESSSMNSNFYSGGIAGYLENGKITDCTTRVDVEGYSFCGGVAGYVYNSEISGCLNEGDIVSGSQRAGGIAGCIKNDGKTTIADCINTGTVIAGMSSGGIAGDLYGNTSVNASVRFVNCINHGDVLGDPGGILSYGDATFIGCVNTGTVKASVSAATGHGIYIGGIVSWASNPQIIECVNTGTIRCDIPSDDAMRYAHIGGLVGRLNATKTGALIQSSYSTGTIDIGYAVDYNTGDGNYSCKNFNHTSGIGGLVGGASWLSSDGTIVIENSYAAGSLRWGHKGLATGCSVCDELYVPGGLVGVADSGQIYTQTKGDSAVPGLYVVGSKFLSAMAKETMRLDEVRAIGRQPYRDGDGLSDEDNRVGLEANSLRETVLALIDSNGKPVYQSYDGTANASLPILRSQELVDVAVHDSRGKVIATLGCPRGFYLTEGEVSQQALGGKTLDYAAEPALGYGNYRHIGWSSQRNASSASDVFAVPRSADAVLDIYPVFAREPIQYMLSYDIPEDATMPPAARSSFTVESATFVLPGALKEGDEFLGWYLDEDRSGARVTQISTGTTGDVTLYSKWASDGVPGPIQRAISYHNLNGATGMANAPLVYQENGIEVSLISPKLDGYTFEGWYESSAYTGNPLTTTLGRSGDLTLWAKWKRISDPDGEQGGGSDGAGSHNGGNAGTNGGGSGSNGGNAASYGGYNVSTVGDGGNSGGVDAKAAGGDGASGGNEGSSGSPSSGGGSAASDGSSKNSGSSDQISSDSSAAADGEGMPTALVAGIVVLVAAGITGGVMLMRNRLRRREEQYGKSIS